MGYDPTEPYKVSVPNVNDTDKGLLDITGPGLPEGWGYGEYQGPYSGEWYDEQKVVPLADELNEYPGPSEFVEGMGPHGLWKDYDEDTGEYGKWAGPYDDEGNSKGSLWKGALSGLGEGLMGLANQQSYDYKLF